MITCRSCEKKFHGDIYLAGWEWIYCSRRCRDKHVDKLVKGLKDEMCFHLPPAVGYRAAEFLKGQPEYMIEALGRAIEASFKSGEYKELGHADGNETD